MRIYFIPTSATQFDTRIRPHVILIMKFHLAMRIRQLPVTYILRVLLSVM